MQRMLDILLGPAATAAKQALFGPVMQLGVYAPAAIWLVTHRDEIFTCMTYGQMAMVVLMFAWSGWVLTRRRPSDDG